MKPLGTGDPLRLGPYRLLGVLGEGGMGKVYFGLDGSGTHAAVKVLRPELSHDQQLGQRFVREAQMAQSVTSKGVARVLGSRMEGGRPWIATEFLAGPTLDEAIASYGPMDCPAVRALAAGLARTLHDIHVSGLVHRDLKPSNIVMTSTGPRIIDFGIARPEHGLTLTTTGQIPVTPGYGAPEQILGQRVGPAADVFSLGAVLVFAASGRRAFDAGHVAAVQYEVVHGEPNLTQVPAELQPLIAPCLAKDASVRPGPHQIASAFEAPKGAERAWKRGPLADDIRRRESGVKELTTLPTTGGVGSVPRRRLLTSLAAGGTVLAASGGAGVWWLQRDDRKSAPGAKKKIAGAFDIPAAVKTPTAELAQPASEEGILGDRYPTLTPLWGPLEVNAKDSPAPLPVRDVIVFGAKNGGLAAHNVVDGKWRWSAPEVVASGGYVSLSDRLIAAVGPGGKLLTYVPSTGERKWTVLAAQARCVLTADDDMVYVVTKDDRLRAIGRSDATIRWTTPAPAPELTQSNTGAVAAQGRLVISTQDGNVFAVNTSTGRETWQFASKAEIALTPAVHGSTVYLGGEDLTARRLSDGVELWRTKPHKDDEGNRESWSAPRTDGTSVYAMRGRRAQRINLADKGLLWDTGPIGDFRSPVLRQGSYAWIIDDLPSVKAVELGGGRILFDYTPEDLAQPLGFKADGNRLFVLTEEYLLALPVV